jgi:Holliday junction resolvase-like predicted endonuclease/DNA-directed RNA polymerase subunit RPC12/RpoP
MGFVPAGALLASRIGKPILRTLSMTAWVKGMAERAGLNVRLSAPGRRAELTASRVGERTDLLDLLTPEVVQMVKAFQRRQRTPKSEDRDPGVFVESLDPYLSYAAVERLLPGATVDQRHDLFDRLLTAGIFRRGLMLRCADCERGSFVDIDRLGREYECPQCGAHNSLVSDRWKREHQEPTWFYDLYAPMRDLLRENGEVVLAAAAALRKGARTYADSPEIELVDPATDRPVAEIDVIASVDGSVVVVEAKANGSYGSVGYRRTQVNKLLRAASIVRADRIVLATSKDAWTPADVEYLTKRAKAARPFPFKVEVMTSVGQPTPPPPGMMSTEAIEAASEALEAMTAQAPGERREA